MHLSLICITSFSITINSSKIVQSTEDLAVFTALNNSGSFGKNLVKFKKKCYLPLVGLHAHNARQAFPSILALIRYLMGPAKSTPITSNGVLPSVRSVGRSPGGVASAIA